MKNKQVKIPGYIHLFSRFKIGTRINTGILIIICLLAIPTIVLINQSMNFRATYNGILDNLDSISYIMNESNQQGNRIIDSCSIHTNIKESGETEIIIKMQDEIEDIRKNIGEAEENQKNREQLAVVENLLNNYVESYKSGISKCGDSFSLSGDIDFYSMVNTSKYLSKNCTELLNLELERSVVLKDQISSKLKISIENILNTQPGFIHAMWCGDEACELKIKEIKGCKSRCITNDEAIDTKCVCCGKEAKHHVIWGIQY